MQPGSFDDTDDTDDDVDVVEVDSAEEAADAVADILDEADETRSTTESGDANASSQRGADWSPRPSQDKLHADQREVLTAFVVDGYPSRRAFLEGLHDIIWHSLGRLNGNWFAELGRDNTVLSTVITDADKRRRYRDRPVAKAVAKRARRRLAKKVIRPAFRAAYRDMRANATEFVLEDERTDPADSSMFAMRPSMEFLHADQRDALGTLLDGFADSDALDAWLHDLDGVTLGEIDRVDPDFDWRIEMQPVTQRALLGDEFEHVRQRETLAAFYFLPACAYTPQLLLERAKELREDPETDSMQPTNL